MKLRLGYMTAIVLTIFTGVSYAPARADSSPAAYRQMMAKLRSLKSFQMTIQETTILQPVDHTQKPRSISSADDVVYQAPNLFSLINNGLMGGVTVVSDGKQEYFYSSLTQEYASRPAPKDVLSSALGALQRGSITWTSSKPANVDGTPVNELSGTISSPRGSVYTTLDIKRADSLPLKAVISLPTMTGATGDGLKITRTELFTDFKLNVHVPESTFKFVPPEGSTKVDSPSELGSGFGAGG